MITVKEARELFKRAKSISVSYEEDEIDITRKSPASDAFNDYIVEEISCGEPQEYMIYLKQQYIRA